MLYSDIQLYTPEKLLYVIYYSGPSKSCRCTDSGMAVGGDRDVCWHTGLALAVYKFLGLPQQSGFYISLCLGSFLITCSSSVK